MEDGLNAKKQLLGSQFEKIIRRCENKNSSYFKIFFFLKEAVFCVVERERNQKIIIFTFIFHAKLFEIQNRENLVGEYDSEGSLISMNKYA